jgi:hypothetical protein
MPSAINGNRESNGHGSTVEAHSVYGGPFYLAVSYRQIKRLPPLRPQRLCGENPIWDKSEIIHSLKKKGDTNENLRQEAGWG